MFGPNKPTLALAANRLSRWALFIRQFNYTIESHKTSEHSNADGLRRLPVGEDPVFDWDESTDHVDTVCTIETLSLQVEPTDSGTLRKESSRDPTFTKVMRFTREGWPEKKYGDDPAEKFRKIALCIPATQSVWTKSTIKHLQGDFAHFGFPHTVVTDCAATFKSDAGILQREWNCPSDWSSVPSCHQWRRWTFGANFQTSVEEVGQSPKNALQDFLPNYRRTPLSTGYSPSELLNGRQIRTKIDTLLQGSATFC